MKPSYALLFIMILLIGCGSSPKHKPGRQRFAKNQMQQLVTTAKNYLGSPYKYGGRDTLGFDCSGLVNRVYARALGIKLPRTTGGLYEASFQINSKDARAGDLAFFRIRGARIDHVGMMINRYEFIHSSTSRGVIVSAFVDDYYRVRFFGIRRLK